MKKILLLVVLIATSGWAQAQDASTIVHTPPAGGGGGGGTVTSVGLTAPGIFSVSGSPVTTSGSLSFTLATQSANLVWAGPGSGLAAAPTFRSLVAADIPALSYVTSAAMTVPGIFSVSGSPITSSGTFALSLATQSANLVWAGPNTGAAATPTFRSLVAADIPALSYVTSVAMTVPGIFSVGGSPITSSGTLAITVANQNANLVWAGPTTGSPAGPTFRSLVAADIPSLSYATLSSNTFTGAQQLPAGTCAAPTLNYTGATTTGVVATATPSLLFCISGATVGTFASNQIFSTTAQAVFQSHLANNNNGYTVVGSGDRLGFASTTTVTGSTAPETYFVRPATGLMNAQTDSVEAAINQALNVVAKTSNYSVVAGDSHTVFTNTGAGGAVIFTLPTPVVGMNYTFIVTAAQTLEVLASGSATIRLAATVSGTNGNTQASTIGNVVQLVAVSASSWIAITSTGSWSTT